MLAQTQQTSSGWLADQGWFVAARSCPRQAAPMAGRRQVVRVGAGGSSADKGGCGPSSALSSMAAFPAFAVLTECRAQALDELLPLACAESGLGMHEVVASGWHLSFRHLLC